MVWEKVIHCVSSPKTTFEYTIHIADQRYSSKYSIQYHNSTWISEETRFESLLVAIRTHRSDRIQFYMRTQLSWFKILHSWNWYWFIDTVTHFLYTPYERGKRAGSKCDALHSWRRHQWRGLLVVVGWWWIATGAPKLIFCTRLGCPSFGRPPPPCKKLKMHKIPVRDHVHGIAWWLGGNLWKEGKTFGPNKSNDTNCIDTNYKT